MAALAADQVVMLMSGTLIGHTTPTYVGGKHQTLPGQELQRAIDGGFGQPGDLLAGTAVDFHRRQVTFSLIQNVEDSHALWGDAETLQAQTIENWLSLHATPCYCNKLQ